MYSNNTYYKLKKLLSSVDLKSFFFFFNCTIFSKNVRGVEVAIADEIAEAKEVYKIQCPILCILEIISALGRKGFTACPVRKD